MRKLTSPSKKFEQFDAFEKLGILQFAEYLASFPATRYGQMDRLTQLQDAIDSLARMFTNSIFYVHEKSAMRELNSNIPIAQPNVQADSEEVFQQNRLELASDLVKKAQEIDTLIELLPGIKHTEEEQLEILRNLEAESVKANEEYAKAVEEMKSVRQMVTQTLRTIADEQSEKARNSHGALR